MTRTTDILEKFELQVDDSTELSSSEELDLANDVYSEICNDRDWEWLKDTHTDVTSTSVPYISLPTDFKNISPNKDNESVVFVGTSFQEYQVIPFASRRDYRNQDGYCYIDIPNQRLYFTLQPTSVKNVEFDYIKIETPLNTTTSNPLFRTGFDSAIVFGMAKRFPVLEQTDKSTSYQDENTKLFKDKLYEMALEDAKIKLSL